MLAPIIAISVRIQSQAIVLVKVHLLKKFQKLFFCQRLLLALSKKNKHVFLSAAYFRKLLCNSVEKGLVLLVVLPRRGRATENGKLLRLPIQTKHKKIFAIWTDAQVWTLEQVAAKPKLVTECGSSASKCSSLITASRCTAPERSCVGQQLFQAAWEHRNLKHGPLGGLSHCLLYLCRCRRFQWRCIQACKCLAQVIFGLFVKLFEPLTPHQNASSKFRN